MIPSEILEELHTQAVAIIESNKENNFSDIIKSNVDILINKIDKNKSLLSALVTSLLKKIIEPKQDVRLHRMDFNGGYSARTLDTSVTAPFFKIYFPKYANKESSFLTLATREKIKWTINAGKNLKIRDKESTEETSFCIQGEKEIEFSSNLTCVIGGRGSGKSTIIHMLYNLVPGRDADRLDKVNSPLFNLRVGSKDELGKMRSMTKSDIPPSTEFFLQNEVEKFAKDINEMSNLVRIRLYGLSAVDDTQKNLQQLESEWKTNSGEVDDIITAYDEITCIDKQIASLEKQRETLKKQTDVIRSKEYKKLQKEEYKVTSA